METLVLADGTKIDPSDGKELEEFVEVPTNIELQERVIDIRRRLGDLPAPPESMNTLGVVLSYELFGLVPEDISTLTGLSVEQIQSIQVHESYSSFKRELIEGVLQADQDKIRGYFQRLSGSAAERMGSFLNHKSASMQAMAAKDILDRAGYRPNDVVEHKHSVDGGLVIEVIKTEKSEIPTIEHEPVGVKVNGNSS